MWSVEFGWPHLAGASSPVICSKCARRPPVLPAAMSAVSVGVVSSASERRARMAAKAAKPLSRSTLLQHDEARPIAVKQQPAGLQAAAAATPTQTEEQRRGNTASAPALAPALAQSSRYPSYPAYTDDMDDMDATMYIDSGVNALQLTRRPPPAGAAPASLRLSSPIASPKGGGAGPAGASSTPARGQRWEDEVEAFQQMTPSVGARSVERMDDPSPSHAKHTHRGVLTVDSAAEERRLDAARAKKDRAHANSHDLEHEESTSDAHLDDSFSHLSPAASPPHRGQAPATVYAGSGSGWVLPQTRLDGSEAKSSDDQEGEEPIREEENDARGYERDEGQSHAPKDDHHGIRPDPLHFPAEQAAGVEAAEEDPYEEAYQHQMRLQAEQAALIQQKLARNDLSPEDQRQLQMHQKRPPLILDWTRVATKEFFHSAVPRGGWVQCRLIKRSAGFASFLHPKYELYTEEHQGGLFLASARKSSKTKPNYHLSTDRPAKGDDKPIDKTSAAYAGKVAATLSRSDYVVYDAGFNATKSAAAPVAPSSASAAAQQQPREEIGLISYKPHLSGKTPRKLAVLVPILFASSNTNLHVRDVFRNEFLSTSSAYQYLWKQLQDAQQRSRVPHAWICLLNKPPRYHADTGQYVLDFCGRAPQVSVKNFQLVYPEEPDDVLFQLGRLDDDNFSVDFRFPMSPSQAFAIALSSLDYKWTVD